jgi:hypothetical protein
VPDIYDLWEAVQKHPDFAGGAVFTREQVAHALFEPDGLWPDPARPESVARVTEEILHSARVTTEAYIHRQIYTWQEAIRENVPYLVDHLR